MTTPDYQGLRDRDYFHIMLNLDAHDGFRPTARFLAERFLDATRDRLRAGTLEAELHAFHYTPEVYTARMDAIYQGLADDVTRYEDQRGWTGRSRSDVLNVMLQMAPFNQTDGAWLRNVVPVGPMDDVAAMLFSIWSDEVGGGNADRNHATIYTELLRSVDIDLPDIRSRDYADHPDIVDSAYTLPLFQLVVSEFPQDYLPELLGMTQYLEWSSVELRSQVLLNRHLGIDTRFYELHVAIDNAASGHGAIAKQAVQRHLENVRIDLGEEAVQAEWERVWVGYVAFATTGDLGQELAEKAVRPRSPAEKVAAIIRVKAPKAQLNHGTRMLGGSLLNDLFADPSRLMNQLVLAGHVVAGDPDGSPLLALLGADGPMYRVFSESEISVLRDWIQTLDRQPADVTRPPVTPDDPGARMATLVDALRPAQDGTPAHATTLTGYDLANPPTLVTQPVAWWFAQPSELLMAALARSENGWVDVDSPSTSRFLSELATSDNAMARTLARPMPETGSSGVDIIAAWIDAGCPPPAQSIARPITLLSPPARIDTHPTGDVHGSGSVH